MSEKAAIIHPHAVLAKNSTPSSPTVPVEQPLPPLIHERVCRTFIRLAQQIQEIKHEQQKLSTTKEAATSVPMATDPTSPHH